jgi:hypothetical protein
VKLLVNIMDTPLWEWESDMIPCLCPDVYDWLNQQGISSAICWGDSISTVSVAFRRENDAIAFKMRWLGVTAEYPDPR